MLGEGTGVMPPAERTCEMTKTRRAGFFRPFLSGFAIGAVGLIGLHVTQPEPTPMFAPVAEAAPAAPSLLS
jgi:hypothetical protein